MSEIKFTFREKENAVDFASGGKMEGKGCIFQLLVHGGVLFVRVCCYVCGGVGFMGPVDAHTQCRVRVYVFRVRSKIHEPHS